MTVKPFKNTSATQNDTFKRCERKWYLDHTVGRGEQSAAMIRGSAIHKSFLEGYMRTGRLVNDDWLLYSRALMNSGHFPKFGQRAYFTEVKINLPTLEGLPPWIGYVDCAIDEPLEDDVSKSLCRIQDLKTTSDLRYTITREELRNSTQMMSYAHWAYDELNAERVIVEHVVLEVRRPPPKKVAPRINHVSIEVDKDWVDERWTEEMFRTTKMQSTLEIAESWQDVKPTGAPLECNKYGGCQHREICGIDAAAGRPLANLMKPKKKDKPMAESDFLRRLRAKQAADSPEDTEEEEAQTLAPDADSRTDDPPEEGGEDDEVAAMEAKLAAAKKAKAAKKKKEAAAAKKAAAAAKKAPKAKPKTKPPTNGATTTPDDFTLYINCAPVKGAGEVVTHFEDWIAPIIAGLNEWAKEEREVDHVMLLGFADEKAAVAMALQANIAENGLPGQMIVFSGCPFEKEALAALVPHASTVIRAVR